MTTLTAPFASAGLAGPPRDEGVARAGLEWSALPRRAQVYVAGVIALGLPVLAISLPLAYPLPGLFAVLLIASCVTSLWKVTLPIPLASGSTLSVSYAANLAALLLLGPRAAILIAAAGVGTQCTFNDKRPYPLYRTVFSIAAEAITMIATGLVYAWLGGSQIPFDVSALPRPLVGAIATYFFVNTGLVAAAIALSTGRGVATVWRDDFLWSGASFVVAGTAAAVAAIAIDAGDPWKAVLMLAPVYLMYRTYLQVVGRLEDQQRHMAETHRLHQEAVDALVHARRAESELAREKERLAVALADMTRLEELRNQLLDREQSARASAEEANRLKDQFLAIVSHELRTPLNAILGWSDMLRQNSLDADRGRRAVVAINENAKRQATLIDELLDVSRIISGRLRLERRPVDWREIAGAALEVVQPAASAKQIDISVDADPSLGTFYGDGARLQQVVWNLLTNAVKFTPEGGAVHLHLRRAQNLVELQVADNGQGITQDFLPSVFEPFRQADGSTTRRHGGLGLGLSIVKHLVEAHGGTVTAETGGEGLGSTFTVRLPIVPVYSGELGDGAAQSDVPAPPMSLEGIVVLVVDDDDENREVVATFLGERQAVVHTAASADQAIELVQRERVDVLLADIAMPGQDGYDLIRRLRAMGGAARSVPAAALTAFARDEDRQRALQAGFQMHLTKPVSLHTLVEAVARLGSATSQSA